MSDSYFLLKLHAITLIFITSSLLVISSQSISISSESNNLDLSQNNFLLEEIGQYSNRYGPPTDIVIQDDFCFITCKWGGLLIFDISNILEPKLIATFNENREISLTHQQSDQLSKKIEISDDLLVFADGRNGLLLLNITNPNNPFVVGRYNRVIQHLTLVDNFVYVITPGNNTINYGDIIQIIDISDVSTPKIGSELDFSLSGGYHNDLFIFNGFLFTTSGFNLQVFNISNPFHPTFITSIDINGGNTILKKGDALVISSLTSLKVVNISNPVIPIYEKEQSVDVGSISSFTILNDSAFIADFMSDKILLLDISTMENFIEVSSLEGYSNSTTSSKDLIIALQNNQEFLLCVDYQYGLHVLNVTSKLNPVFVSNFDTNCLARKIVIDANFAYIGCLREFPYYPSRLEIVSIENKSNPYLVSSYDFENDTIMSLDVSNNLAFVSLASYGLNILSLTDKENPQLIGSLYTYTGLGLMSEIIYVEETNICYLANSANEIFIVNCTNPNSPFLIKKVSIEEPFSISSMNIEGDTLLLTSSYIDGSLSILDISEAVNPLLKTRIDFEEAITDACQQGSYIYLTTTTSILVSVEVSNLDNPTTIQEIDNGWKDALSLTAGEDFIFVAQGAAGLTVLTIKKPSKIVEQWSIRDHYKGLCLDVWFQDDYVFIADGWDGLEIYKLTVNINQTFHKIFWPIVIGSIQLVCISILMIRRNKVKL